MIRHWLRARALGVVVAAVLAVSATASASTGATASVDAAADSTSNAVVDWNIYSEEALYVNADQQPQEAGLEAAMVQGAVYDAVNAIDGGYQPYLVAPPADPGDSMDAAAATAAYRVLLAVVPEQQTTLQPLYNQSLDAIPDGPAKAGGVAVGEQAAAAMIAARQNDGRDADVPPPVFGPEPGQWRPTPPEFLPPATPWVGEVRPFTVSDVEQFRSNGPRRLGGDIYAQEFNEVKSLGSRSSTTRTPDQTDAALFWNSPPWGSIIRSIAASRGLDRADTARLLAMIHLAAADGAIACFNDKYYWKFWRPVTAIYEAANDGNPATAPDPTWTPLIDTVNHPEHPSGHACATGAITSTLQHFFNTDAITFSAFGFESGTTRSFTSLSQAVEEIKGARVWAGIHFRTANEQGVRIGRQVASELRDHYFQPVKR